MKIRLYLLLFLLCGMPLLLTAQQITTEQSKQYYAAAKQELESMLNDRQPLSYQKAIFLVENAWWDNDMDYALFQQLIKRDTTIIRAIAAQLKQKPDTPVSNNFWDALREENIKGKGYLDKALMNAAIFRYLTDTLSFVYTDTVMQHLPFSYASGDPMGSNDWTNTQVLNLLAKGQGNCFALVSLFKIFSECFHSDANMGTAPGHVYITHRDNKGIQYNVEIASRAFPGTGTLATLTHTTQKAIENDISLRELNPRQSVCLTLVYLAKGYEHKYGLKEDDGFMMSCANTALKYDSLNLNAMLLKAEIMEQTVRKSGKSMPQLQNDPVFVAYQQLIRKLCFLGYREMPLDMKNILIKGYMRDTVARLAYQHRSPAGKASGTRYASLSWGLFDEQISTKLVERYGNTLFDTKAQRIIGFAKEQSTYNQYDFDPVVFAWNVDPMAHLREWVSPYSFVQNNPINRVDPTGALDDWVQDNVSGEISWDKNATSQATTQDGQTYLGKTLTFEFNSFIDGANWDGPSPLIGPSPVGNKLTSTIKITGVENEEGELTGINATRKVDIGKTPFGTARNYYPGLGTDQNKFTYNKSVNANGSLETYDLNYEQHASVSPIEQFGMRIGGYNIVNVAQKLSLNYSGNILSVTSYTDIFPSATLRMNGIQIMYYRQPSFTETHSFPILFYSPPAMGEGRTGGRPYYDHSYKPAMWYKR